MKIKNDPRVDQIFENYPDHIRMKMQFLKELVIDVSKETEGVDTLEITTKWGEPSFVTKYGSTLRMDWKEKTPDQYALYFQCTSRLVDTFRLVYGEQLRYEGTRAIVFHLDDEIPVEILRQCIRTTLMYHKVKDQITLGL